MQDLRIILVIIGALAIAALVIHGLWTNRKNKRISIKEKPLGRMPDVKSKYRDDAESVGDGFDEDGIGKVRVVSRRQEPKMPKRSQTCSSSLKVAEMSVPCLCAAARINALSILIGAASESTNEIISLRTSSEPEDI